MLSTHCIIENIKRVLDDWENRIAFVEDMIDEIKAILGNGLTEDGHREILQNFYCLKESLYYLKDQAEYPELVLATTGMTSSGKSTLANFLIGEAILPSAVQEMSAGLVRVKHGEKRSLTIPETKGATWETGRWENLTADEVSQRLEATMMAFREEEESNKEVEPVLFEIEWPIRFAERKKELNLPEGTQVTILDLPGLKAVNDKRNGTYYSSKY